MKRSCKELIKRAAAAALSAAVALSLAGCSQSGSGASQESGQTAGQAAGSAVPEAAPGEKVVNVGVTSSLNTLNPLLMDGVEINKYATGLMFLPLVELDANMEF